MGIARIIAIGREDLRVIVERDPSIGSTAEALLHPSLPAVWLHRLAHALFRRRFVLLARAVANLGRMLSGIEIHPGAVIGRRFFVDHGAAVVIGGTAVIGDDVTIYHQVTLGAVGWWRDMARPPGQRRHPLIGNNVTIGANATILGPVTVGDRARIGAQALVVADVPPGCKVVAPLATIPQAPPNPAENGAAPRGAPFDMGFAATGRADPDSAGSATADRTEGRRATARPVAVDDGGRRVMPGP